MAAQIEFADGSTGQLLYSAEGDPKYPKEMFTIYAAGLVGEISNYQELIIHRGRQKKTSATAPRAMPNRWRLGKAFLRGETRSSVSRTPKRGGACC